ncbi:hypothetical protein CGRA01v4_05018 [Colletotrichum graminicola]|nr:hypothetical protein CGRA01v4_05018 [Colletotrichum graminicola]
MASVHPTSPPLLSLVSRGRDWNALPSRLGSPCAREYAVRGKYRKRSTSLRAEGGGWLDSVIGIL